VAPSPFPRWFAPFAALATVRPATTTELAGAPHARLTVIVELVLLRGQPQAKLAPYSICGPDASSIRLDPNLT